MIFNKVTAYRSIRFLIFILFAAGLFAYPAGSVLAISQPSAHAAQQAPSFESGPCMFDLPVNWVEGKDVDCGYLIVPEQYDEPDGSTIRLAVAIIHSQDPNPQPDPLVMLQGGPGGSTIDIYSQALPMYGRLPGNRDIVLFDQRGTLYSDPALTCPEYMDLTIETLNQDLESDVANQMSLDALAECRERLAAEGANLNAFDSIENAHDVESLRQALGYDQINLYGVSYGTLLALHVMREHPAALRSVILDSVVPTQVNFITGAPQTMNRSFEALFAACEADQACAKAYPDLRSEFYNLIDRLNEDPITMQVTDFDTGAVHDALVDGDTIMSLAFQAMYSTELIPLLPRMIFDVRDGQYNFTSRILSLVVFDRTMSYGMYYSVVCAEDGDFSVEEYNLDGLPEQIVAVEQGSAETILKGCALWNVEALSSSVDEPVSSDIPTLVVTGEFDPITPPDYAREAAKTLSNSYLIVFPAGGHGEISSSECADNILLDFLDDPYTEPDSACVGSAGPDFVTRSNLVSLPILTKILNLEGGTAWQGAIYLLVGFFFFSALLVYPLVWIVRMFKRKPAAQPVAAAPGLFDGQEVQPKVKQKPLLYRLAPWMGFLAAGALLIFTVAFIAIVVQMVAANDMRVLLGLPGMARPLFLLPWFVGGMLVLMLLAALTAWVRGGGSVWGRLYLTLLCFAGFICLAVLAWWGVPLALFA